MKRARVAGVCEVVVLPKPEKTSIYTNMYIYIYVCKAKGNYIYIYSYDMYIVEVSISE